MKSAIVTFTFPRDYALAARGVREARGNWSKTGWEEPVFYWAVKEKDARDAEAFADMEFRGDEAPFVVPCRIEHGENLNAGAATTEAMLGVFAEVLRLESDAGGLFKMDSDILWHRPEAYTRNIDDFGVDYIGVDRGSASLGGTVRLTCSGALAWISRTAAAYLGAVPRKAIRATSDAFRAEDMVWSGYLLQYGAHTVIDARADIAWHGKAGRGAHTIFTHDNPYRR